ncbi:hypothetical protein F7725_028583 [Dissostichus mawsoni]|uniref:GPI ethanolamine phosphate transferase 1 n=1 Tax=Dissostichus mawsoni TaxID=36200 RepID=A0A7J5XG33_DISMA|nr:hypothetical protein F7725_028583 [Dissostichus mawsoni]
MVLGRRSAALSLEVAGVREIIPQPRELSASLQHSCAAIPSTDIRVSAAIAEVTATDTEPSPPGLVRLLDSVGGSVSADGEKELPCGGPGAPPSSVFTLKMKMITFLLVGLIVHVIFFVSIFDIYFTSPLVHGMTPQTTPLAPPASRLVLVVADGLRADSLFTPLPDGSSRAPYLRLGVCVVKAVCICIEVSLLFWECDGGERYLGVSHTRVPTESRPGHVALIAGFYEDVSAVAKGWKENPVEFDSVFNESRHTWCWGSPDILPMFAKGASGDHSFFQSAKSNSSLRASLLEDQNILFLHLLGIDTNGHAHRPMSKEYLDNIGLVDTGVADLVSMVEDFFDHDGRTAYVFTSDHGMTNWGSHGAGHPSETLTPLVAWGAGVKNAQKVTAAQPYNDGYLQDWKLEHLQRVDVNQADIAPLMASLIGVPFPVNSVGVLPLLYLNNSDQFKAESIYTNAIQVLEQYKMKMAQKKETTLSFLFTPYQLLTESKQAEFFHKARILIQLEKYDDFVSILEKDSAVYGHIYKYTNLSVPLSDIECSGGPGVLPHYDRFFLGCSVVLGFVGWTSYVVLVILKTHASLDRHPSLLNQNRSHTLARLCICVTVVITVFLLIQRSPVTYYIYCLLPVPVYRTLTDLVRSAPSLPLWKCLGYLVLVAFGIELLVVSFFHRAMLTVGLAVLSLWPFLSGLFGKAKFRSVSWCLGCLCLAAFPLMPVVGREPNIHLVTCAGVLSLFTSACYLWSALQKAPLHLSDRQQFITQMLHVAVCAYVPSLTHSSLQQKQGLPLLNQIISWTTVFHAGAVVELYSYLPPTPQHIPLPHSHIPAAQHRVRGIVPPVLSWLMFVWINIEQEAMLAQGVSGRQELSTIDFSANIDITKIRQLKLDDIRRSYFFVSFLDFDPASVYCFLTVFNPFIMGGLMMWKVIIPFIIVMCTFETIQVATQLSSRSLFLIVLVISDLMALDYGSWLDIGTSISHYVIVMSMTIFLMLLSVVTHILTSQKLILWRRRKTHFP